MFVEIKADLWLFLIFLALRSWAVLGKGIILDDVASRLASKTLRSVSLQRSSMEISHIEMREWATEGKTAALRELKTDCSVVCVNGLPSMEILGVVYAPAMSYQLPMERQPVRMVV